MIVVRSSLVSHFNDFGQLSCNGYALLFPRRVALMYNALSGIAAFG